MQASLICKFKKLIFRVDCIKFNSFLQLREVSSKPTSEEELKAILKQRFPQAKSIEVTDRSGGCGAMFDIYVETKEFNSLSLMKQHRAIYDALNKEIKQIHGLHINTKAVK